MCESENISMWKENICVWEGQNELCLVWPLIYWCTLLTILSGWGPEHLAYTLLCCYSSDQDFSKIHEEVYAEKQQVKMKCLNCEFCEWSQTASLNNTVDVFCCMYSFILQLTGFKGPVCYFILHSQSIKSPEYKS